MVIQATARHDYKRAATVVNTMAYAPFQVGERQWTDVFEKNEDRISQDGLEKLLDALQYCDVSSEATLLNLKRSLHSLCRSYTSRDFSNSVSVSSLDDNDEGSDGNEGIIMPKHSLEYIDGNPKPGTDPPDASSDAPSSEFHVHHSSTRRDVAAVIETVSRPLDYISDEDGLDSTEIDEEIEALINAVDDSHDSPSAKEIMKDWKERRKKDGILFPFQK